MNETSNLWYSLEVPHSRPKYALKKIALISGNCEHGKRAKGQCFTCTRSEKNALGDMKVCKAKECKSNGVAIPLEEFGTDKSRQDGKNPRCKKCVSSRCKRRRSMTDEEKAVEAASKKAELVDKYNFMRVNMNYGKYLIEYNAMKMLMDKCAENGVEIRQWPDGTKSDFGIRPIGITKDLWLPQQLKSTDASCVPLTFSGCNGYYCDIVCVAPNFSTDVVFHYSKDFVDNHIGSLSGIDIRLGIKSNVWYKGKLDISEYFSSVLCTWNKNIGLKSEKQLCEETTLNFQKERRMVSLAKRLDADAAFEEYEVKNSSVDRVMNGLRIQDKCASLCPPQIGLVVRCAHGSNKFPYTEGDNDAYCFHYEYEGWYFQWLIPESELVANGSISKLDKASNRIVEPGSGTVCLQMAERDCSDSFLKNMQLQHLGGWPRWPPAGSRGSSWTSRFVKYMKI